MKKVYAEFHWCLALAALGKHPGKRWKGLYTGVFLPSPSSGCLRNVQPEVNLLRSNAVTTGGERRSWTWIVSGVGSLKRIFILRRPWSCFSRSPLKVKGVAKGWTRTFGSLCGIAAWDAAPILSPLAVHVCDGGKRPTILSIHCCQTVLDSTARPRAAIVMRKDRISYAWVGNRQQFLRI